LGQIGIQSDQLRKILGVAHAERHALTILADLDRFADEAGILDCKLCRFARSIVCSCAAQCGNDQESQTGSAPYGNQKPGLINIPHEFFSTF
jgi:hypothetical protein